MKLLSKFAILIALSTIAFVAEIVLGVPAIGFAQSKPHQKSTQKANTNPSNLHKQQPKPAASPKITSVSSSSSSQSSSAASISSPSQAKSKDPFALFNQKQQKAPTYVSSLKLTVDNVKRVFEYSGDVEVIQADMLLTSKRLVGTYSDDNQIQSMTAFEDVMITKGENIRASGNRADYDGVGRTFVLTENPELQQQGSILTADRVKVYLNENRSEAEGNVRVKLANKP